MLRGVARGELRSNAKSLFVAGCAFLGLLIVAVASISLMKANELVKAGLMSRLNTVEASFLSGMEQESFRAFSMAEIVARDPEIIEAFAAQTAPSFNSGFRRPSRSCEARTASSRRISTCLPQRRFCACTSPINSATT
jgi:hypothetical protein